jgi:hypothetical protein
MRYINFLFGILSVALQSSCIPSIDYSGTIEYNPEDSTYAMAFRSIVDDDELYFDTMFVRKMSLSMEDSKGNTIIQNIIIPAGEGVDYNNPLLVLPYYRGRDILYYPLMSYSKDTKRPLLVFNYRGNDEESGVIEGDIETDKNDLLNYIDIYKGYFDLDSLDIDVFANSYGGILYALTDFFDYIEIDQVVFESVPINYANTIADMDGAADIAKVKNLTGFEQEEYESRLMDKNAKGIMYLYGTNDDGIRLEDVEAIARKTGMDVKVIENAYHLMRIRYPLDSDTYNNINQEFMDFLDK